MDSLTQLDRHLSERIRREIEERYLTPINARTSLDQAICDPLFCQNPEEYPPRTADQSVVHHRDVADQILYVLNTAHGLLIHARDLNGLAFIGGCGAIVAYPTRDPGEARAHLQALRGIP